MIAFLLATALQISPVSRQGSCRGSLAELGVNMPIGSRRRSDAVATIFAVVRRNDSGVALGWLYRTQGGSLFYQDNRSVSIAAEGPVLQAVRNTRYHVVADAVQQRRGTFIPIDAKRGAWGFLGVLPTAITPIRCVARRML